MARSRTKLAHGRPRTLPPAIRAIRCDLDEATYKKISARAGIECTSKAAIVRRIVTEAMK